MKKPLKNIDPNKATEIIRANSQMLMKYSDELEKDEALRKKIEAPLYNPVWDLGTIYVVYRLGEDAHGYQPSIQMSHRGRGGLLSPKGVPLGQQRGPHHGKFAESDVIDAEARLVAAFGEHQGKEIAREIYKKVDETIEASLGRSK